MDSKTGAIAVDGFTTETFFAIAVGLVWLYVFSGHVKRIEETRFTDWYVSSGGRGSSRITKKTDE